MRSGKRRKIVVLLIRVRPERWGPLGRPRAHQNKSRIDSCFAHTSGAPFMHELVGSAWIKLHDWRGADTRPCQAYRRTWSGEDRAERALVAGSRRRGWRAHTHRGLYTAA